MDNLELTDIWQKATWGAGFIGDAIAKQKNKQPVRDELAEAEALLSKAVIQIRHLLTDKTIK